MLYCLEPNSWNLFAVTILREIDHDKFAIIFFRKGIISINLLPYPITGFLPSSVQLTFFFNTNVGGNLKTSFIFATILLLINKYYIIDLGK